MRWWRRPEVWGIGSVLLGLIAVIAVRLGPALVGAKTFSAMDRLGSVAPWWDGGVKGAVMNPYLGDSIDSLLPSYIQIHDRLMQGDWALWSALGGPGTELLSSTNTPSLTLSTIWFLLLPTVYAPGIAKLVEIIVAMLGMYLWMRRIGLGRPAGLIAGVFYCGSGFFVGWATWSAQASVASMMPALFWAVEYLIARKRVRAGIPLAIVVALLLLGGFPAAAGHALYAAGLYFIVRLIADRTQHTGFLGWRVFFVGVGAVLLGVALSAVQIVPLAFGLADTDLSSRSSQFFSQQPVGSLLSMFYPGSMFRIGFGSETNPIEGYAFLGIGAVFFALVAVITPRLAGGARGVVPFLAIGALLAAAVVWYQGWWTVWLANLPIFSGNNSGRLRDLVCLFGAALAAIGVERVFTAARSVRTRILVAGVVSGLGFAALTLVMWMKYPSAVRSLALDAIPGLLIIGVALIAVIVSARHAVRTGAFVVVALLAALQMSTSVANYWPLNDTEDFYPETALIDSASAHIGDGRMLTSGGFMGSTASAYGLRSATAHSFQPTSWREYLVALDLGAFTEGQSPTNPNVAFPGEESTAQAAILDRLGATIWVDALSQTVPGEVVRAGGSDSVPDVAGEASVGAGSSVDISVDVQGVRGVTLTLLDAVGTDPSGAVPTAEGSPASVELTAELRDSDGEVVATGSLVRQYLPAGTVTIAVAGEDVQGDGLTLRITSSADVRLAAGGSGAVDVAIIQPTDDGLELAYADANGSVWVRENALPRIRWASETEVIDEGAQRLERLQSADLADTTVVLSDVGPVADGADADLTVEEDSGDVIRVRADAAGAGYLVVADWMHRGWTATVDGEQVDIVEADHALSAVYVAKGVHEIEFTYVGQGAAQGVVISLAAVLVIVCVLVLAWLRRRRGSRSDE